MEHRIGCSCQRTETWSQHSNLNTGCYSACGHRIFPGRTVLDLCCSLALCLFFLLLMSWIQWCLALCISTISGWLCPASWNLLPRSSTVYTLDWHLAELSLHWGQVETLLFSGISAGAWGTQWHGESFSYLVRQCDFFGYGCSCPPSLVRPMILLWFEIFSIDLKYSL